MDLYQSLSIIIVYYQPQYNLLPHSLPHPLTHALPHSRTHPPTLLRIFPWQFYLFTALYQLPHCYWCDLSRVLLAYQPTVHKDVPDFKQMTHARRSKYPSTQRSFSVQCYRLSALLPKRLTTLHQTSRSIATDQVILGPYLTCIFVFVCVPLYRPNFNCVIRSTSQNETNQVLHVQCPTDTYKCQSCYTIQALPAAQMETLLPSTLATCFGYEYAY